MLPAAGFAARLAAALVLVRRSPLGLAISFLARFKTGHGLQFVTDKVWISALGIHYKLGVDGLNLRWSLTTTLLFCAALLWAATARVGAPAPVLLPLRRSPRAPCSARSSPRTSRCSWPSST